MSGAFLAESIIGSAISWTVFTFCAYAWAKRKLLPLYHKHVREQAALLAAAREARPPTSSPPRPTADPMTKIRRGY